jgi:hypothetical protein
MYSTRKKNLINNNEVLSSSSNRKKALLEDTSDLISLQNENVRSNLSK